MCVSRSARSLTWQTPYLMVVVSSRCSWSSMECSQLCSASIKAALCSYSPRCSNKSTRVSTASLAVMTSCSSVQHTHTNEVGECVLCVAHCVCVCHICTFFVSFRLFAFKDPGCDISKLPLSFMSPCLRLDLVACRHAVLHQCMGSKEAYLHPVAASIC